jgi:phenylpyruvate tautomerase PptA (4-oxalocrotonate tautomerase family)
MPVIRVTYPAKALTDRQKEALAPLLIDAVMLQEVDPITEMAREATLIVFNEIPQKDCYLSKEPCWLVEAAAAAGFFNQKRRDVAQAAVSKAFVEVLGNDGSSIVLEDVRVSPSYLSRLWVLLVEIPEGSWGGPGAKRRRPRLGTLSVLIRTPIAGPNSRPTPRNSKRRDLPDAMLIGGEVGEAENLLAYIS